MSAENGSILKPADRPDADVHGDVLARLRQGDTTRALEHGALSVEVHDGEVVLLGHVATLMHRRQLADLARGVAGVKAVHDGALVADPELATEVAQALADDPATRGNRIRVRASNGWIQLIGEVPDQATRAAAGQVAAQVARVRGVLVLPEPAEAQAPQAQAPQAQAPQAQARQPEVRQALQPRLGEAVYATNGPAGQVVQVVINPQNRLVSHVVVAADWQAGWHPLRGGRVVPVEVVGWTNASGLYLTGERGALAARPAFREADFPPAPAGWQPPFPYAPGTVRWPAEDARAAAAVAAAEAVEAAATAPKPGPVMAWDDDGGAAAGL
jgi:osmotically-inducible protein OsmY